MALGEGAFGEALSEDLDRRLDPVGGVALATRDGFSLEPFARSGRNDATGIHDHTDVPARDAAVFPGRERGGIVLDDRAGVIDAALHRAVRDAQDAAELRRDRPQRHIVQPHRCRRARRLLPGQLTGAGQQAHLCDLGDAERGIHTLDARGDLRECGSIAIALGNAR